MAVWINFSASGPGDLSFIGLLPLFLAASIISPPPKMVRRFVREQMWINPPHFHGGLDHGSP